MKNRFSLFFLSVLVTTALTGSSAQAETPTVKKALENVKESLDTLITTKDEKKGDDLSFRIDTYRMVLTYAVAETKDLKVKLLALEGFDTDPIESAWRKGVLVKLAAALERYDSEQKFLDGNEGKIDVARIKSIAEAFKGWRDTEYAEVMNQVREMLIIDQQLKTLDMAGRRYQKVEEDVAKIRKAKLKGFEDLEKLLKQAEAALSEAKRLDGEALLLFKSSYFPVLDTGTSTASTTTNSATTTTETAAPAQEASTTTSTLPVAPIASFVSSSVTSTPANATTTASSSLQTPLPPPPPSIKDLVKQSLVKTKETYKVFIEMSNFVRELLK